MDKSKINDEELLTRLNSHPVLWARIERSSNRLKLCAPEFQNNNTQKQPVDCAP
jgi:hypothetical protein